MPCRDSTPYAPSSPIPNGWPRNPRRDGAMRLSTGGIDKSWRRCCRCGTPNFGPPAQRPRRHAPARVRGYGCGRVERQGREKGDLGMLTIRLKRAYDAVAADDGPRVLVDRVWPRGVTKDRIEIDAWLRDLGPSTTLRQWFGHDPRKWEGFRERYRAELARKQALLAQLAGFARHGKLTLVYSARDTEHNQAVVIKEMLEQRPVATR